MNRQNQNDSKSNYLEFLSDKYNSNLPKEQAIILSNSGKINSGSPKKIQNKKSLSNK